MWELQQAQKQLFPWYFGENAVLPNQGDGRLGASAVAGPGYPLTNQPSMIGNNGTGVRGRGKHGVQVWGDASTYFWP